MVVRELHMKMPYIVHTTPIPAITRPTIKAGQWVSSCKPTPSERIMHETTIPHLRPTMSPIGYAKIAPKKVPAERMDTCKTKQTLSCGGSAPTEGDD